MSDIKSEPVKLRGASISYFTGKMENYFRLKGIPYQLEAMNFPSEVKRNQQRVGISQMPVVGLPDGRWMTDSTKMIQWFEGEYPQNPVVPEDPVLAYICYLLEDWADEWWWRPAMHYRWYYEEGARFCFWSFGSRSDGWAPHASFHSAPITAQATTTGVYRR